MTYRKKNMQAVSISIRDATLSDMYLLEYKYQVMIAALLGIFLFLILYWVVLSPVVNGLSIAKDTENRLKQTYSTNVNKLASMSVLEKELSDIKRSSKKFLDKLPGDFSPANIVQELYEAGAKNDLRINVNKHLQVKEHEALVIHSYELETSGTYAQLEKFCLEVGQLKTLVVLKDLKLSPIENMNIHNPFKEMLRLQVIVNAYQTKE
ncbi:MAG: type 4a pilus biogenesis protein PilO [Neisseriaceae bacterium]|nr:MAG: type 4a pilus biogenesis protein PilO [Neisseriaceae bacterium]